MASSSPERDPATYFGFTDTDGFKDFVVYVLSCAPDLFPKDDWRGQNEQMNLDRAFVGLRYGLTIAEREKGASTIVGQCQKLIEDAYTEYQQRRDKVGQLKLEEVEALLKKLL